MARSFPRPLARRQVLYGSGTPGAKLVELGHAYLEEGLLFDAADFFSEARDRDGLKLVKARARESGDAFLLRQVQQVCPELVSNEDWDELAARAKELGKDVYAARAEAGGAPPPPPLEEERKEEAEAGGDVGESDAGREVEATPGGQDSRDVEERGKSEKDPKLAKGGVAAEASLPDEKDPKLARGGASRRRRRRRKR